MTEEEAETKDHEEAPTEAEAEAEAQHALSDGGATSIGLQPIP